MGISSLDLILYFRSPVPGRWFVRCVCSKVAFLSKKASFTTGLIGWVDRSRSSLSSNVCVFSVGIVRNFIVGVDVCLTTIIFVVIVSTIRFVLGLVFLSFELTALVSILAWLFAVVASWFGFFWVLLRGLLRHKLICSSSGASKPFISHSLSRCHTICSYVLFSKFAWLINLFR